MSDTSFTRGIDEDDFSLDEAEEEGDTTATLLANARKSVNLAPATAKRTEPEQLTTNARSSKRKKTGQENHGSLGNAQKSGASSRVSVNFLNSDKWAKDLRPPHLQDDHVFNMMSVESAANFIMQWMTTKALIAGNEIKENKARTRGGKEKPDEEIKKVKIEEGEDNSLSILHKQRFNFRTPLKAPSEYWHLVPKKWKEINKSIYLENVGMDNICSPRTLELLHNRSSPLEIKMFLTLNISVGRAGASRKQNLRTLDDGTTEVVSSDDWLSPTSISQLIEALDNLVAIWVIMWPGEWSMVAMRRTVTKHLAFGDISDPELRKKMLEAFINEVLTGNASLAARGKPPMEFDKLDKLATRYLDNKKHYASSFKTDMKETTKEFTKKTPGKAGLLTKELKDLRISCAGKKPPSGKDVCFYFNTTQGCRMKTCQFEHSCCYVKVDKLCGGNHKKSEHRRN